MLRVRGLKAPGGLHTGASPPILASPALVSRMFLLLRSLHGTSFLDAVKGSRQGDRLGCACKALE